MEQKKIKRLTFAKESVSDLTSIVDLTNAEMAHQKGGGGDSTYYECISSRCVCGTDCFCK